MGGVLPVNVGIEASALGSGRGGDETFLRSLLSALALVGGPRDQFPLYCAPGAPVPPQLDPFAFPVRHIPSRPSLLRYAAHLPLAVARERPRLDLLLSTNHAPPISPAPLALLVHDVSFIRHPAYYPVAARLRLGFLVPRQARRASLVVTVSDFSRDEIVATLGIPPGRVAVVPNAVEPAAGFGEAADIRARARLGLTGTYVLYVGNLHPRKNVDRLIAAFHLARSRSAVLADTSLVIAGAPLWDVPRVADAQSVRVLGRVTDDDRGALLRGASALAYVSLYEGFGLPPLEAMAAGIPVLAARAGAIPEVTGDAALLVDPLDVRAIADGIERLASDPDLRRRLVRAGQQRVALYGLRAMGERALAAFERVISHARAADGLRARGSEA